jgi:4-amino-4-deoxy-L-arabinose transferase-like glycosyltransferase
MMRRSLPLSILALYLFSGLGYLLSVPLWEAPDEPAHFLYAHTLAETGELPQRPQRTPGGWLQNVTTNYEWHQPPLYYWLVSLLLRANRAVEFLPAFDAFPPIVAEEMRVFMQVDQGFTEVHLARLLSLLAGFVTIGTIYSLAARTFPAEPLLPVFAAGFAALIPQFTFLHGYATNDSLAILFSTLTIWAFVNIATSAPSSQFRAWIIAGLILSVGLTVKLTTWFLMGVAILLAVFMIVVGRVPVGKSLRQFGVFALIASTGLLMHWAVWPDLPHRFFDFQSGGIELRRIQLGYLQQLFVLTHSSFWGHFGWMNLPIPFALQLTLDVIALTGLVACGAFAYQRWREWEAQTQVIWLLLVSAVVLNTGSFLLFNLTTLQPQGRFFFPVLSIIAMGVAYGWLRLARNYQVAITFLILGTMFAINIYSLWGVIRATYIA